MKLQPKTGYALLSAIVTGLIVLAAAAPASAAKPNPGHSWSEIGDVLVTVTQGGTGASAAFTPGSVIFAGPAGVYHQANSDLFWDDINHRLGLGTTAPNEQLHLYSAAGANAELDIQSVAGAGEHWAVYNDRATGDLRFWNTHVPGNASHALQLQTDGTVVAGQVRLTSGAGSGKVLTSDASGNASWQDASWVGGSGSAGFLAEFTSSSGLASSLVFDDGANIGIGTTSPDDLLTVGAVGGFKVSAGGAVTAATGISSSGTVNFSGLTASQIVLTDASKNLTTAASLNLGQGGTGLTAYTAGDIPYYASGAAFSKLGIGAAGYVLTSTGSAPQWTQHLGVGSGGTGAGTFTANGVLLGNGAGAVGVTAAGSAYQPLRVPSGGGAPAFGAIDLAQAAAVTGMLAVGNGGTGATTSAGALTNLLPAQTGNNGKFLTTDGSNTSWSTVSSAVTSVFGRTGPVTAQANDYTWAQIDKTTSSLADLTTRNISDTTGTLTVARGGTGLTAGNSGGVLAFTAAGTVASSAALAQYGVVYGGGAGAAPAATAAGTTGQVLLAATGAAPSWGQASLTSGVTGTLPVANGGTGAASLAANNVLLGNGTSALQTVAPGTSGYVLTSNGTTWSSAAISAQNNMLAPIGLYAANVTTATALATNTSYFLYVGKATSTPTSCTLQANVTTAAATITWAEVGIFTGSVVVGGAASLSRVGYTNVAATFNTAGIKTTTVTVSGVNVGDDLWIAYGSQATTPYQLRGVLADNIQSGVVQTFAGRISTMAVPSATTLGVQALVPAWIRAKCN